ncbi:hypothetical protein TL16_g04862 [Triparma laevis f. inornata]|uniref:START domain-containing protein n=2 Tax=Triparma laevis TaxID=1534972 RepID=A0A9W7KY06_9STRA|nr:hypothetical protein TL16_g04862 [Triparma laevis f. inornata]GMI15380.1 hypothetical protein TrLO_g6721 [Triparma laevis f. longispina]
MRSNKIMPMESQKSTALSVLSSPEAKLYIDNRNTDLNFKNEKVLQMDNIIQHYTDKEDEMISSGIGLLRGMEMKGAIPFKNFKTKFSATSFMQGFYNAKDGDIYGRAEYTARGDHSRVAARLTNYWLKCFNPALGAPEEEELEDEVYLELPNTHSTVFRQVYNFPSPLSDREGILYICWKRISDKTIAVVYHPLTHYPKVENKDGTSMIRSIVQSVYQVTQLDDLTTEMKMGLHINFGGSLPKVVVNGVIFPGFDRIISKTQVYFVNSIELNDLNETDGQFLG